MEKIHEELMNQKEFALREDHTAQAVEVLEDLAMDVRDAFDTVARLSELTHADLASGAASKASYYLGRIIDELSSELRVSGFRDKAKEIEDMFNPQKTKFTL